MKTIYYFYIGMGVIALLFITVYFINNPLDKTVSKFKYPYFLSIKPSTISADQSVEILVTSTNQIPKNENNKVFVFNPIGVNTTYDFTSNNYYQKFTFPKELKGNGLLQTGNYSVILISGNTTISAASFNVVYNAFLASFGNFAFTSGLPLTIGLIISIISTGFQFASSREAEDRRAKSDQEAEKRRAKSDQEAEKRRAKSDQEAEKRRQQSEKSKWMVENAKYYLHLFGEARRIYTYFPKQDTKDLPYYNKFYDKQFDKLTQNILYHVIRFYRNYTKFVDEFNMYYFNDLRTENFLSRLDGEIILMYNQIFGDSSKLLQFSEKSKWEFENDYKIKDLLDAFEKWISEKDRDKISNATNVERFLYLHLIYATVLFVAINEMVHELYAKEIEHKNAVFNIVEKNYETLKVGLDVVNKHIYKDVTSSYFHLMFHGEDLIKE